MWRIGHAFLGVRALQFADVARKLDYGHLHAIAQTQVRNPSLPRVLDRIDLALDSSRPESTANHDRVHSAQAVVDVLGLQRLGIDPMNVYAGVVDDAAVLQCLSNRYVRVAIASVFADDPHRD